MGVILKRLGATALVLGVLYATFFRAGAPADESTSDPRYGRLVQLMTRQRQAMVLWSALAARDSALVRVATMTIEPGEPQIVAAGFPQGTTSPEAAAIIRDRWKSVGAPDPSARVLVLLSNDAVFDSLRPQVYPYSGALIVPTRSSDVCVAMSYGSLDARGNIDIVNSQLDLALAPCLLRAAFGPPGTGVKSWLEQTRFAAAQSSSWLNRPKAFLDGSGQSPWQPMYDETWSALYAIRSWPGLISRPAIEITMMFAPPYVMGGPALRCLEGNHAECARTVLDSVSLVDGLPRDLTFFWGLGRTSRRAILSIHPLGNWFLSDVIREEGRERFARFWKSDQPFESAFRDAFGQELGAWTRAWGVRQRTRVWDERYSPKSVILGASLKPSWLLLVLGWTAVAVLIAAWTSERRQVTA